MNGCVGPASIAVCDCQCSRVVPLGAALRPTAYARVAFGVSLTRCDVDDVGGGGRCRSNAHGPTTVRQMEGVVTFARSPYNDIPCRPVSLPPAQSDQWLPTHRSAFHPLPTLPLPLCRCDGVHRSIPAASRRWEAGLQVVVTVPTGRATAAHGPSSSCPFRCSVVKQRDQVVRVPGPCRSCSYFH